MKYLVQNAGKLISVILFIFFIVSFNNKSSEQEETPDEYLIEFCENSPLNQKNEEKSSYNITYYDKDGNKTETAYYDKNGKKIETKDEIKNEYSSTSDYVYNVKNTKEDSIIMERYVSKLCEEFCKTKETEEEEFKYGGIISTSDIVRHSIIYSPDNVFKIFIVEYIYGGIYLSSRWYSWIHYDFGNKEKVMDMKWSFFPIENIYKLPDNKYLIIENECVRHSQSAFYRSIVPSVISFEQDSLVFHPISLSIEQPDCYEGEGLEPYINYDSADQTLYYSFKKNEPHKVDWIFKGQFKYVNGEFILENETIEAIEEKY